MAQRITQRFAIVRRLVRVNSFILPILLFIRLFSHLFIHLFIYSFVRSFPTTISRVVQKLHGLCENLLRLGESKKLI